MRKIGSQFFPQNFDPQTNRWRFIGWTAAALILIIPAVSMLFTSEMNWGLEDFALMAAMLFTLGFALEVAIRITDNKMYRIAVALILIFAFLVIWAQLAVGI